MSRLTQILRGKKLKPLTDLESAVATALKTTGSELPAVTGADNGDILKVVSGEWSKADAELPAVTSTDNGNILKVADGAWTKAPAELPAVTADDNGDILKVADGAWAKAAAPADKSPLVVTGTVDSSTVTITTALADIKAAFDAGRMVFLDADNLRYAITACIEEDNQVYVTFDVTFYDTNDSAVVQMHVEFENALTGTLTATTLAAAQV